MDISFLKKLLINSGNILKDGFGRVTHYSNKHDQSNIVTEYDLKSEDAIRSMISTKYPDHNVLGEENGFEDKGSEFTWIIDPLDGTSNFAAQIPWFGILIALIKDNKPILGGGFLPLSAELYLAEKNRGAFKNNCPIHVTTEVELKNLLCCYSLDYSKDISKTEREVLIIKNLVQNFRNLRSTNSLVDFCMVADGRLGSAINQTMKIWDIAAPQLILEEAGAKVTDIDGNSLVYSPSSGSLEQNFTAVAANPVVHEKLLKLTSQ